MVTVEFKLSWEIWNISRTACVWTSFLNFIYWFSIIEIAIQIFVFCRWLIEILCYIHVLLSKMRCIIFAHYWISHILAYTDCLLHSHLQWKSIFQLLLMVIVATTCEQVLRQENFYFLLIFLALSHFFNVKILTYLISLFLLRAFESFQHYHWWYIKYS